MTTALPLKHRKEYCSYIKDYYIRLTHTHIMAFCNKDKNNDYYRCFFHSNDIFFVIRAVKTVCISN